MTLKQMFEAKLQVAEAEVAKIKAEMESVGPLIEHEVEQLKAWVQAVGQHIGL